MFSYLFIHYYYLFIYWVIYYSPDTGVEMNNKRIETTGIEGGGGYGGGEGREEVEKKSRVSNFLYHSNSFNAKRKDKSQHFI